MRSALDSLIRQLPFLLTAALVVVGAGVTVWLMAQQSGGMFLYGSDDFYINLGLARRLVDGTAGGEFPSGSTCAGWIVGMAVLIKLTGAQVTHILAGVINLLAALLTLWVLGRYLKTRFSPARVLVFLLSFIWMTGLVPLILMGMEHVLQILFVTLFGIHLLQCLEGDCRAERYLSLWVLLGVLCRMEMVFVAAGGALVLLLMRRYVTAVVVLIVCAIPTLAQGIWQIHQGHSFFANPILIKTVLASDGDYLRRIALALCDFPDDIQSVLLVGALLAVVLLMRRRQIGTPARCALLFLLMFLVCAGLHQMLARNRSLGRYNAYLIGLGALALAVSVAALRKWTQSITQRGIVRPIYCLLGALLLLMTGVGRAAAWYWMPNISREIYSQMYQIARLAREVGGGEFVILNDVGCTLFFTDVPVLDLFGLTSWETAKLGGGARMATNDIVRVAKMRHVRMAVLYPRWFESRLPSSWVAVGEWETPPTFYADQSVIRVYATSAEYIEVVQTLWKRFARSLPDGVIVRGR